MFQRFRNRFRRNAVLCLCLVTAALLLKYQFPEAGQRVGRWVSGAESRIAQAVSGILDSQAEMSSSSGEPVSRNRRAGKASLKWSAPACVRFHVSSRCSARPSAVTLCRAISACAAGHSSIWMRHSVERSCFRDDKSQRIKRDVDSCIPALPLRKFVSK